MDSLCDRHRERSRPSDSRGLSVVEREPDPLVRFTPRRPLTGADDNDRFTHRCDEALQCPPMLDNRLTPCTSCHVRRRRSAREADEGCDAQHLTTVRIDELARLPLADKLITAHAEILLRLTIQ